jgi:hypothetical protein
LHLGQRTQIIITGQREEGSRVKSCHLAIADKEQTASGQTLLNSLDTRDIEGIISSITGNDVRRQRHPKGIKNGLHDFDWR